MTGDLNMNNNKIVNVGTPKAGDNAVNKEHVDTEILKVDSSDTFLLDGSNKLLADLHMNNNKIVNLTTDIENPASASKR